MSKLLKKTLVFIISVAMVFTVTGVSFAAIDDTPGGGAIEVLAADTDVAFEVTAGDVTTPITVGDMKAAGATEVTEEAPWFFNSTSPCFGTFYSLKQILTNKGIPTESITGVSAFASDGFISSYADSDIDNIYVFDMSEVSRNGSYGAAGTYGAGLYKEDGSAAGNTWPTNVVNITMAKAADFSEAAIGKKYYNTLVNALAAKGKKDKNTGEYMRNAVTVLKDVELENAPISTDETEAIDLNGCRLTGTATITGTKDIEFKDGSEGATGFIGLAITASEFSGKINCPETYVMTEKDGVFIIESAHNLTKTKAKAATYTAKGNKEYFTCSICGKFFSDEAGTTEIEKDSWVIAKLTPKTQKVTVKASTKTVKQKTLKKKAVKVAPLTVKGNKGKLSYAVAGGTAKAKKALSLNKKTGKVTVKKKTKKGTYTIKVKVTAAATADKAYKAFTKTVKVTVKVK